VNSGSRDSVHKHELLRWAASDGAAAERHGDWSDAAAAYQEAADLQDDLFEAQTTRLFAERQLGNVPDLTSRLAYSYIRSGQLDKALIAVEIGRARMLTSAALLSDLDFELIKDHGLRTQIARVMEQLRHYEQARTNPDWVGTVDSGTAIKALRAEYRRLQSQPGAQVLACPAIGALRQDAADRDVICLCAGEAGGAALIVPADPHSRLTAILLPAATLDAIGDQALKIAAVSSLLKEDLRRAVQGIDSCCNWLSSAIVKPITDRIMPRQITFIATSWFTLLPFRAAWHYTADSTGKRYLLDGIPISMIPNLRALSRVRRQRGSTGPRAVLIAANPGANSRRTLPSSQSEGEAIGRLMPGTDSFIGAQATRSTISRKLPDCTIAHFACHARSNTGQPLESGVQLAGDEWLRVHDIMQLSLANSPHVILSACETAGIGRTAPDEGVGLPVAFLQAGARGVIASSWPVHDDSTSLLMVRLYDELQRGPDDFRLALSRAQAWLRDASQQVLEDAARRYGMGKLTIPPGQAPYAHPFFWAAFDYTG
jgi:CHAT domain-containing protein